MENMENKSFIIPKHNEQWVQIEQMLYKELLTHLSIYNTKMVLMNTLEVNDLVVLLTNKLLVCN